MPRFFPISLDSSVRAMVFVDGGNLAIRYGKMLMAKNVDPADHVFYNPNVFVRSIGLN